MPVIVDGLRRSGLARRIAGLFVDIDRWRIERMQRKNPYRDKGTRSEGESPYPVRVGILKGVAGRHWLYQAACEELQVAYSVVDIVGPDWQTKLKASGCDAFVATPCVLSTQLKHMLDERLRIMTEELGLQVYPDTKGLWLHESKRRMHYWLEAQELPHPDTFVFHELDGALQFARDAELPLVMKTDLGSGSRGVRMFRKRSALMRAIRRAFTRGTADYARLRYDREAGFVILQTYVPDIVEWRVIRIGESFFAHQKLRRGDFHSGTGLVGWYTPPHELLDFVRGVTDRGPFTCMAVDTFETGDGRYLVNELQTSFGSYSPYQMLCDGQPGRFLHRSGTWEFEPGIFCQHGSSTLKIVDLMARLGYKIPMTDLDIQAYLKDEEKTCG